MANRGVRRNYATEAGTKGSWKRGQGLGTPISPGDGERWRSLSQRDPCSPEREGEMIHIVLDDYEAARSFINNREEIFRRIEDLVEVDLSIRGTEIFLRGSETELALARVVVEQLYALVRKGVLLTPQSVDRAVAILGQDSSASLEDIFLDTIYVAQSNRNIAPKGLAQKAYVEAMRKNDIVFAIGPAGTGKTYLAMAAALSALMRKEVRRIVLTRPAVEAGERLGFLPGDLYEKVNPYLRPLYDALHDMMEFDQVARLLDRGAIEIAPLAFMRGRTLNSSFVILDEAQNTTSEQMKMFLTRLGYDSQAVITGDITQIDLPQGQRSGLVEVADILQGIKGIAFCRFTEVDVVRHPLVQDIIRAYEDAKNRKDQERKP